MKCSNCHGEWTPPKNTTLTKCPFCQTDIIQLLNQQEEMQSTEVILQNMLQVYGIEILQDERRLKAIIADLFAHDRKTKKRLFTSINEQVPQKIASLQSIEKSDQIIQIHAIQHRLMDDADLKEEVTEQIVDFWVFLLDFIVEYPDNSYVIVEENGLYGFQDASGKMIIPPFNYSGVKNFQEGLALVQDCNYDTYGFIDKKGREIIPIRDDSANSFNDGLAMVGLYNKYGFIDKTGREVIPIKYDRIGNFVEGLAIVMFDGKYGFIDKTGREIIQMKYDNDYSLCDGLAKVTLDGKCGVIDNTGHEITPIKYDDIGDFIEGKAKVELGRQFSQIDKTGREVIPIKYDHTWNFSDDLAVVDLNGKIGFIDNTGKLI